MTTGTNPTSPKPEADHSLVEGASEADAKRSVAFEPNPGAGPDGPERDGQPSDAPDAQDRLRTKGSPDEPDPREAEPGVVAPEDLSTESDDGAA